MLLTNAEISVILYPVIRLQKLAWPVTGGAPAGAPFFIPGGILMPKPFMTYAQQIQKMKDKHLLIPDEAAAETALRTIGYFSLVSGYKDLFKNPTTRDYRDGTTFDDILALYHFDESLRELTLRHLLHIEQHIRSELSYAFCQSFGDSQNAYIDPQNYHFTVVANQREINTLIKKFLEPPLTKKTDYAYIEHHKRVHQNVPLWVLMNMLTFGTLSKMYALSKPQIQSTVSREFDSLNERQLAQILQVLTVFRNVCAHGERLFSYRCARHDIPDLPLHKKLSVPQKGTQYLYGKKDYFSVVISFRYLLPHKEFLDYKMHLVRLIEKAINKNQQISEAKLLELMGMPLNWKKITAYKKV